MEKYTCRNTGRKASFEGFNLSETLITKTKTMATLKLRIVPTKFHKLTYLPHEVNFKGGVMQNYADIEKRQLKLP